MRIRNFTKVLMPLFFLFLLLNNFGCNKTATPFEPNVDTSFLSHLEFKYYAEPIPVKWMGKTILGYELHGYNFDDSGWEIYRIDILANSKDGQLVKSYSGNEFEEIYKKSNVANGSIMFLWPEFDNAANVPDTLYHKIYFTNGSGEQTTLDGIKIGAQKKEPIKISSPVRGKNWLYASGPSNLDLHHRRAVMSFQSHPFNSQRFAVDLIRFADNKYQCDPNVDLSAITNDNFYCYSDTLYAVADGTVFNMRDGLPDLPPGQMPELNIDNGDGNYIILEILYNNGSRMDTVYANYAHIKTGSLLVNRGQTVHKGDPIGLLGNSGNTNGPHLHFHIQTKGYGAIFAQGLPYTIEIFHLQGINTNTAQLDESNVPFSIIESPSNIYNEMPAMDYVVDF